MLILKDIIKDYVSGDSKVRALNGITVAFRKSEFVSILGHSGCGKTTLLNIVGGLDRYTDGDITIKGVSTKNYKDADWDTYRNHSIGFVFQNYNLIPHQTVISNVELALTLSGVSKAERRKRAEEMLIKVGLGDQLYKKPGQMSGGQMQRVAIARALINDPEILLADEPTGALDTDTSVQIMDILREISKDKLIIMVTHNAELAEKYSDRIIRLKDGQIIGDSNPYSTEDAEKDTAALIKAEAKENLFKPDNVNINVTNDSQNVSDVPKVEKNTEKNVTQKRKKDNKQKRPSMSFFTAIGLSFNNLLTKKVRTFMTSFAGSIGIIGIALILSLSNGINAFISRVQKETLSSYPIMLQKEEVDISAFITNFMGENSKPENADPNKIYSNSVSYNLLSSIMNPATNTNNLDKFKEFLDKDENKIKDHSSLIRYGYDADINAYLTNPEDNSYYKADINELFVDLAVDLGFSQNNASSMLSSSFSSFKIWEEMLPPKDPESGALIHDMIKDQYEIIAGKWPENKNEVVLLVSSDNRLTDLALYSLGLISEDDVFAAIMSAISGNPAESQIREYTYDQLLGISYKLIPTSDYYYWNVAEEEWMDYRDSTNANELNGLISGGLDVKICGIIRQNSEATTGSLTGTIIYTSALTDYLIEEVANSDIVKAQNATPAIDIFNGLPFTAPEDSLIPESEKPAAFKSYIKLANEAKKAEIYKLILTTPSEDEIKEAADRILAMAQISPTSSRDDLLKVVMEYAGGENGENNALIIQYFSTFSDEDLYKFIYNFVLETAEKSIVDSRQKDVDQIINAPSDIELDAEKTKILFGIILNSAPDKLGEIAKELANTTSIFNLNVEGKTPIEIYAELLTALDFYSISSQNLNLFGSLTSDALITNDIKKGYIFTYYKTQGQLSDDEISALVNAIQSDRIPTVFDSIINEQAFDTYRTEKAPSQSEASKNKKLAKAFEIALENNSFSDSQLIEFYDEYVPVKSSSTLEDNLALFGSHDKNSPDYIAIYPNSFEDKEVIADIIEEYNNAQTNEDDKISYTDYVGLIMSSVTSIIDAISYVLIFFVSISLIVSSIMIGIITYISVLERSKEIGILRAMGASKRDVANVFNAETLIVGFTSGAIGIIITILLNIPIGLVIKHLSGISGIASLPVGGAIILVIISMTLTLISGLIPARIAAKKDPVEALRSE